MIELRRSRRHLPLPQAAVIGMGVALVTALLGLVFFRPIQGGFVSDAFVLYARAMAQSPLDLLRDYLPAAGQWYRPSTDVAFWLESRVFATSPLGYHVVTLGLHLLTTAFVSTLVFRMTGNRVASIAAAAVFLLVPQAHEALWDVADLHTALSGPTVVGAVLAYAYGRRALAVALVLFALSVDEAGILAAALIVAYEVLVVRPGAWRGRGGFAIDTVVHVAPFLLIGAAYVLARLATGPLFTEGVEPCRSPVCLAIGAEEYVNRLTLRPDLPLSYIWLKRPQFAVASAASWIVLLALLRPWAWERWRPAAFGAAWAVGSSLFFILSLWPYVPDRFLYLPAMGVAILIGSATAEVVRLWASPAAAYWRGATGVAAAGLVVWVGLGGWMLTTRGEAWTQGGRTADEVVRAIKLADPNPPTYAVLAFEHVPDAVLPTIPPGNSGAWIFHNGESLEKALRIAYGRSDIRVVVGQSGYLRPTRRFDLGNGRVVLLP